MRFDQRGPQRNPVSQCDVDFHSTKVRPATAEVPNITAPTLVVVGDWDAVRIGGATRLFELLGGGAQDAQWDRSGMGQNHFAVIPNATHYDIINTTAISELAIPFLDGYPQVEETSQ